MATSVTRTISLTYTGDVVGTEILAAAVNAASAGTIEIKTLSSGDNTITVPTGGTTPASVTIVPPAANVVIIKLKGAGGDTGVTLHLTDPTSVALATTVTTFIINTNAIMTGCRFYWT